MLAPTIYFVTICTLLAVLLPRRAPLWQRSLIGAATGLGGALWWSVLEATLGA